MKSIFWINKQISGRMAYRSNLFLLIKFKRITRKTVLYIRCQIIVDTTCDKCSYNSAVRTYRNIQCISSQNPHFRCSSLSNHVPRRYASWNGSIQKFRQSLANLISWLAPHSSFCRGSENVDCRGNAFARTQYRNDSKIIVTYQV